MNIREKILELPEGTQGRVLKAAHVIARKKHEELFGPGARYAAMNVLFYDDDTWKAALKLVEDEDAKPKPNELDGVILALAEADRRGEDAWKLHEERVRLMNKGLKPTIKPFCYQCNSPNVPGFGALCKRCLRKVGL